MLLILLAILGFSPTVHADPYSMTGSGLDGQSCNAWAEIQGGNLISLALSGATNKKEIDPQGHGMVAWKESLEPESAGKIMALPDESPSFYRYFANNSSWFSRYKIYDLSSNSIPEKVEPTGTVEEIHLELELDGIYLKSVVAVLVEKAFYHVEIKRTEFRCAYPLHNI